MIAGLYTYAATALIAGSVAFGGAWYWQELRHDSHIAKRDKADAAAKIKYLENVSSGLSAALADNAKSGVEYVKLQQEIVVLERKNSSSAKRRSDLERLLSAQCPRASAGGVQSDAARSDTDAGATQRSIDHWLAAP